MSALTVEDLKQLSITTSAQRMDNGEIRARLMVGASGYIWTESPKDQKPTWQNAHYHMGVRETYIVERGMMAMVEQARDGSRTMQLYKQYDVVTTMPSVAHNVYLFPGSAIHTVKHGTAVPNPERGDADWYPADVDFDAWSKGLDEDDILKIAN
jgi:mannose-6-phosphate isomerase-like protein (cupin superfamily)